MVPLCRSLATSYDAGIPILKSLEQAEQMERNGAAKRVLRSIAEDVRKGSTLEEAARGQSKFLSPFFVSLLASGERGGRLDIMLRDLADYFEDRLDMQRHIRGVLAYPLFQLVFAYFAGTFALGLVRKLNVWRKAEGGGADALMQYVREYVAFQLTAMGVLGLLFIIAVLLSRAGVFQWISGAFTTFIWPMSVVTRKFALARFFRSFALLLGSGLHINRCIESAAAITANPFIEKDLLKALPVVREGGTLVEAFSRARSLTPMSREMLRVGELSGELEKQMKKISEYHLKEATHAVQVATKFLSIMIVLGVGGLVGYIVISFWTNFYGGMLDELGV